MVRVGVVLSLRAAFCFPVSGSLSPWFWHQKAALNCHTGSYGKFLAQKLRRQGCVQGLSFAVRPMLQPGLMQLGIGHCLVLGTLAWLGGKDDGVD